MPKTTKSRTGPQKSGRRRAELRRNLPKPTANLIGVLQQPSSITAALLLIAFALLATVVITWSRDQVRVRVGQVMTETRLNRIDFVVRDKAATDKQRLDARDLAPLIYRPNTEFIKGLEAGLNGLPVAVAGKTSLDEISQPIVDSFKLTDEGLKALQSMTTGGEPSGSWKGWVRRLVEVQIRRHPILLSQEYQIYSITSASNRALLLPSSELERPIRGDAIELRTDVEGGIDPRLRDLVLDAGFPLTVAPYVTARLAFENRPTIDFDSEMTAAEADRQAAAVPDVLIEHRRGDVIYSRGDVLSALQHNELMTEVDRYRALAPPGAIWLPRIGLAGLVLLMTGFLGLFLVSANPRILRNPYRLGAVLTLMLVALAITSTVTAEAPNLLYPGALAPTLFVAIVMLLAYDQRLALYVSGVQSIFVVTTMGQGIEWMVLLMVGCGVLVAALHEVRHRSSLIRAGVAAAGVLAAGSILLGLVQMPITQSDVAAKQILFSAVWSIVSAFGVCFLVLGILPGIERLFDITTGMTLAELRDPKQPLLRQLQQKAPGTYNHSLQVANISEAAAEAIGADSLLVYVGALYHDVGKMNKPHYFVENQAGGVNKHDNLSPAMSLLVIIGHVKDGVELAKEYGLPRELQHFIESHHGTTLVEYFYHAARTQAEQDPKSTVKEVEFRYPGPKPRSKEAGILMLADAVESATRAMTEPNPSRIESLVRELARKRLTDGQFDECGLTFRELGLVQDAIITRVTAIYHGRIAYPIGRTEESAPPARKPASA